MIGDTRESVRMDRIRWYELPEARQLASLGKAGQQRLQWMLFYSFNSNTTSLSLPQRGYCLRNASSQT